MDLVVQPSLVERVVFEAARCNATLRPHYERQFADCYEHRTPAARDRAFASLHERWFTELGLRDRVARVAAEFSHFRERVGRLMVTQAPGPRLQTAELFGTQGGYTVVVAVAPATLLDAAAFDYWARHEFLHVDDLLNPAFGYDAKRRPAGATPAERNLSQDRYAVLWAVSVDARLSRRGSLPDDVRPRRVRELTQAFGSSSAEAARRTLDDLWRRSVVLPPTHAELLAWAEGGLTGELIRSATGAATLDRPAGMLTAPAASSDMIVTPPAGAACPLCGFPTFDWMTGVDTLTDLSQAVRADFPQWQATQPICGRCAEVYLAGARAPAKTTQQPTRRPAGDGQSRERPDAAVC